MKCTRVTVFALALCAACAKADEGGSGASQPAGRPAPQITSASGVVALSGSLHPGAVPGNDRGRLDADLRLEGMSLTFQPSGTQAARDAELAALSDPTSPEFHHWLTPEGYAAKFGASAADVARVSSWLASQGFEVLGASRTATSLFFSGTVRQLEHAFRTEMHSYDISGERHFALGIAPSVPAEFSALVLGLRGVHDFRPAATPRIMPNFVPDAGSSAEAVAPSDWATIYDVSPLYGASIDGTGQTIAIAGQSEIKPADILSFRKQFGLSATPPMITLVPNSGKSVIPDVGNQTESSLDVEWSGAIARNATVHFVYTGNNPAYSVYDAATYAIDHAIAPVLSFSFGGCELDLVPSEADYLGKLGVAASMMGITFVVASGDSAAAGCDRGSTSATHGLSPSYPADLPTVVAVGGTTFESTAGNWDKNGNAIGYIPEEGWNDTAENRGEILGGGGGVSTVFAKPFWQIGTTPNDKGRDVPDLALTSAVYEVPYVVLVNGQLEGVGGTSCAAPSFAGIMGLVNQATGASGQGNVNPVLYALATSVPTAFHDIKKGDNIVPCASGSPDCKGGQLGYSCTTGFDLVTGNGSIDANVLVSAWQSLNPTSTSLTATPSGTTEGSKLTLDATVASNSTVNALTGQVTFYFETLLPTGEIDIAASLGDVPVTPTTTGGKKGATAELVTTAPPGLTGSSTVVAVYGGDSSYLSSWSNSVKVSATSTFAVKPATVTLDSGESVNFTTTGGVAPVTWYYLSVSAGLSAKFDPSTGMVTAGCGKGGTIVVAALDKDNAQATATVTIVDTGCDAGGGDSGMMGTDSGGPVDSGGGDVAASDSGGGMNDASMAMVDAAPDNEAGVEDAGKSGGGGSSGCGCVTAGGAEGRGAGALLAIAGAMVLVGRRRRRG